MPTSRGRVTRAMGAIAVVAAVAAPGALAAPAVAGPADQVPTEVYDPWLWQATVEQRPTGPATMLFFTARTRYLESTGVLVGRDGGYRLLPLHIGEDPGRLSPDGRHYLHAGTGVLLDVTSGDVRRDVRPGVRPLAWSPGGLLGTRNNDDAVITYGPDNQPLNDPSKPDDLLVVDPYTGAERIVPAGTFASYTAAAWSADGTLIAAAGPPTPADQLAQRERLVVTDSAGAPRWQVDLGDRRVLAGRAAWSPDGRRIALLGHDGCAADCRDDAQLAARSWRIEYLDAATGRPTGAPVPLDGWPAEVVGWRGADPVLSWQHAANGSGEARRDVLAVVSPDGGRQVLLTAPQGTSGVELPHDLLARAAFGGPAPHPSPFAAPLWIYALLALPPLLLAALLRRRRRRSRAAAPPASTPPA
ncbi:hypothetical protein [Micromonospora sp. WMMD812]|uniref:hypothetical protein n=1 Tax=Micromonospora sp. WMMD812 TaxID=3015152 RepID=UPI00248BA62B|nr:hypothetical protein [Micromonospora sp. WMMD812]WBB67152.1 hypothetical protein O7603_29260 [Micromonospora sp. WMMD812]